MKERFVNQVIVEGYIFDHNLEKRTSKAGQDYIGGTIQIATDEEGMTVVPVRFIYVTPTYKNGNPNRTYSVMEQIIDAGIKFVDAGISATKVKVTGSIGVNDFLGRDGNMVCVKEIAGSFCDIVQSVSGKAPTFEADMLICGTKENEVENGDDYLTLDGYCFNFRGDLLPVSFSVVNPNGMKYFESQEVSQNEPMFIKVWGEIVSTIIKKETVVESDWGDSQVNVSTRTITAWNITGSSANGGDFDDESTITKEEFETAKKNRIEFVAQKKADAEEYRNSKQGKAGFPEPKEEKKAGSPTASKDFVF